MTTKWPSSPILSPCTFHTDPHISLSQALWIIRFFCYFSRNSSLFIDLEHFTWLGFIVYLLFGTFCNLKKYSTTSPRANARSLLLMPTLFSGSLLFFCSIHCIYVSHFTTLSKSHLFSSLDFKSYQDKQINSQGLQFELYEKKFQAHKAFLSIRALSCCHKCSCYWFISLKSFRTFCMLFGW